MTVHFGSNESPVIKKSFAFQHVWSNQIIVKIFIEYGSNEVSGEFILSVIKTVVTKVTLNYSLILGSGLVIILAGTLRCKLK